MLSRVALHGFADSDLRGLSSFLRELGDRRPGYRLARSMLDADLILADGDSDDAIASIVSDARIAITLFLSERRPAEAVWHVVRPTNPVQLLIGLDELAATVNAEARTIASAEADDRKLRAKAAARRARFAASASSAEAFLPPPDILVLDKHGHARDHLCAILEHFGFCTYPARDEPQALWLLQTRPFGAAFLDIALGDGDEGMGIELCQRVKHGPLSPAGGAAALFIVSQNAHSVDRILASLAGCDAFLTKPLGRGDVARALEGHGIRLPTDERRGR